MIKEMLRTIKMWENLREKTQSDEMSTYYSGLIEGTRYAIALIRQSRKINA